MGSGKSTYALQLNYSLKNAGFNPLLLKPKIDIRDGVLIKSRIGLSAPAHYVDEAGDIIRVAHTHMIIDEAQFLSKDEILYINNLSIERNIPAYFFGLRTAYNGELFKGAQALLAIADEIIEIPLIYKDGEKATMHIRYIDDKPIFYGYPIKVGDLVGQERYESVSRLEYFKRLKEYEDSKEASR